MYHRGRCSLGFKTGHAPGKLCKHSPCYSGYSASSLVDDSRRHDSGNTLDYDTSSNETLVGNRDGSFDHQEDGTSYRRRDKEPVRKRTAKTDPSQAGETKSTGRAAAIAVPYKIRISEGDDSEDHATEKRAC